MIDTKSKRNAGNGDFYRRAYNSFITVVGKESVRGFDINIKLLQKWEKGMMEGVMVDGLLKAKISDTTRGIYLTHCRAVWNEAARRGFFHGMECPFSTKEEDGKICIPAPDERHDWFVEAE